MKAVKMKTKGAGYLVSVTSTGLTISDDGGLDCYPMIDFVNSILNDVNSGCDVYKTCDITAPGIIACLSAEQGGMPLDVPDFSQ